MSQPLIIAHRGWSGGYPENTLAAIQAAIQLGVDLVEIDIQQTRDGELLVFHDYRLNRIYRLRKRVRDAFRHELPNAPTLTEVLRLCQGKVRVLIEIKGADGRQVARTIEDCQMQREVIVFSIKPQRTREVAEVNPEIPVFGLAIRRLGFRVKGLPLQGWGVSRRLVTSPAVVTPYHQRGLKLFVWTVNRAEEMQRLADWGVDGLITNHPDQALAIRFSRPTLSPEL